jgi:hypothetical protein
MLLSCSAYSLTLKMEVACSSKMSSDFQWTAECYIPVDTICHTHSWENLKSYQYSFIYWTAEAYSIQVLTFYILNMIFLVSVCLKKCCDDFQVPRCFSLKHPNLNSTNPFIMEATKLCTSQLNIEPK